VTALAQTPEYIVIALLHYMLYSENVLGAIDLPGYSEIKANNRYEIGATGVVAFGNGSALVQTNNMPRKVHYLQQLTAKATPLTNSIKKATA